MCPHWLCFRDLSSVEEGSLMSGRLENVSILDRQRKLLRRLRKTNLKGKYFGRYLMKSICVCVFSQHQMAKWEDVRLGSKTLHGSIVGALAGAHDLWEKEESGFVSKLGNWEVSIWEKSELSALGYDLKKEGLLSYLWRSMSGLPSWGSGATERQQVHYFRDLWIFAALPGQEAV